MGRGAGNMKRAKGDGSKRYCIMVEENRENRGKEGER